MVDELKFSLLAKNEKTSWIITGDCLVRFYVSNGRTVARHTFRQSFRIPDYGFSLE